MKHRPIHEHQDGRGMSVRYAYQRDKRRREKVEALRACAEGLYFLFVILQTLMNQ